jgi:hypothetical protein
MVGQITTAAATVSDDQRTFRGDAIVAGTGHAAQR